MKVVPDCVAGLPTDTRIYIKPPERRRRRVGQKTNPKAATTETSTTKRPLVFLQILFLFENSSPDMCLLSSNLCSRLEAACRYCLKQHKK